MRSLSLWQLVCRPRKCFVPRSVLLVDLHVLFCVYRLVTVSSCVLLTSSHTSTGAQESAVLFDPFVSSFAGCCLVCIWVSFVCLFASLFLCLFLFFVFFVCFLFSMLFFASVLCVCVLFARLLGYSLMFCLFVSLIRFSALF
jgi:hypothetical protein